MRNTMGRPKGDGETPKRNVRVPDPLWSDAKAKAKSEHTTITNVVVAALRSYAYPPRERRLPPLPDDVTKLAREAAMDHPGGPAFPRKSVPLGTNIDVARRRVLLDSSEVSAALRALAATYKAPLHRIVADDLERMADEIDMGAITALDDLRGP
jgi:hypothetical protein